MYVAYFSLREPPFSIAPDPAYLYLSARHQEALGHLLYGTGQYGGFVQLTGEVGTGKTTIVRTLLSQKLNDVDVAMIHNPRQSEIEFVESICDELGVSYAHDGSATLKQRVDALNAHLLRVHASGRRTVLIIDEAQNLSPGVLEQVRLLTNLETDKEKLLRIMLVGQPELAELLARPDLRQLASRITARYHLLPLKERETAEYIAHRLRVAGGAPDLFTPAAVHAIHRRAGGVPRLVNIICDRALLGAYAQRSARVTPAIVAHASAEALGSEIPRDWRARWHRWLPRIPLVWVEGVLACIGLVVAGVLLQSAFGHRAVSVSAASSSKAVAAPSSPAIAETHASPAVATSSPAPAVAAAAGLGTVLDHPEPLGALMGRLIDLWDDSLTIPPGSNVCDALAQHQLECYRGKGQWSDLDQMNRPALLTLSLGRGATQYVLLRSLGDDTVVLDTASGAKRVPLSQIGPAWNGEYLLLWRNPAGVTMIGNASPAAAVTWLRDTLAQINGNPSPDSPSPAFDASLRRQVMAFQRDHGLDVDGIAGTQTLLALTQATDDPGPELHSGN